LQHSSGPAGETAKSGNQHTPGWCLWLAGWLAGWCCTERKFYRARVQRLRFDTQAISFKYYETPSYNEWSETLKLAAITAQRVRIVRSAAVGRRLILMRL
jgi:hypothetical protein